MFRLFFVLFLLISCGLKGQDSSKVQYFAQDAMDMLGPGCTIHYKYLEKNETVSLYIRMDYGGKVVEDKFWIADVHPLGIFLIDKNEGTVLRILSKCNKNVFSHSEIRHNGLRLGKSTNFIDIALSSSFDKKEEICLLFKGFVNSFIEKQDSVDDVLPPSTRN